MSTWWNIVTLICGGLGTILFCVSCGTKHWKDDEYVGYLHSSPIEDSSYGLWGACYTTPYAVSGYARLCDPYLPLMVQPPWFKVVRISMVLACIGTGVGCLFYLFAFMTDNRKKTGSRFWPSGLMILLGGVCGAIALIVFTCHKQWVIHFETAGGNIYANYWNVLKGSEGNHLRPVSTVFGWSYMVGWGGVLMASCSFITAIISGCTTSGYNPPTYI